MAEITTTQSFSDGDTVTATKLNNIQANASVQPDAITNRTAETTIDQANDLLLIYDASATALKKVSASNLIKAGTASNFPVTGNATIGGTLGVTGNTTLSGTLGVTGTSALTGNTTIGGTLGVTGTSALGNATIGGTLGVTGAITATSTINGTTIPTTKTLVTTVDTQTLTNKTLTTPVISSISNTGTLTLPIATDTLVGRTTTDTLTNKTLTTPIISSITNTGTLTLPTTTDTIVGRATTDTLTNKTLTNPVISSIINTGTLTLPTTTGVLVGRTTTDTLTNKTLTTPIISSISNTGTLTLPISTDTLVGRATTDTLTNKTLTSPVIATITNTGTITLPTSTDTLVGRATTDTLTNKTLTSPQISGGTINNAVIGGTTAVAGSFTTLSATSPITTQAGTSAAPAIIPTGDTNTGIFFPAADTIAFSDGGTERLRIASAGQIGIGGANYGTTGQVLTSAGTGAAPSWQTVSGITRGTAVASTSGTAIDFTGIPSTVKRITVIFNVVSLSGSSNPQVQIGSGSIDATGYVGSGSNFNSGLATSSYTAGFGFRSNVAAQTGVSGHMIITNISGNIWVASGYASSDVTETLLSGGVKTLSGVLDRIRITTVNGTDTFDLGSVNIMYE